MSQPRIAGGKRCLRCGAIHYRGALYCEECLQNSLETLFDPFMQTSESPIIPGWNKPIQELHDRIASLEEHIEFLENALDEIAEKADCFTDTDDDQWIMDQIVDLAAIAIDPEHMTTEAHFMEALDIIEFIENSPDQELKPAKEIIARIRRELGTND